MKNIVKFVQDMKRKQVLLFFLFFFITLLYFAASQIPVLTEYYFRYPNTIFPWYHTNSDFDFNAYLSVITQSKNGAWLMRDAYTTEPTNPTLFYFFFILVGKFALMLQLEPNIAYQVVRLLGVLAYIITLWRLCHAVVGPKRGFLASILAIIGTIAPFPLYGEPEAYLNYTDWWGNIEAANRLDQMPHYMWSAAFLFIVTEQIFSFLRKPSPSKLLIAFVLSFAAGLFFPPMIMPVLFCLPASYVLAQLITFLRTKQKVKINKIHIIGISIVVVAIVLSYLLMLRENQNGFPWDTWSNWERARWKAVTAFDRKLFISFGLYPYIALATIPIILLSSSVTELPLHLFILLWAYLPFLLLPITNTDISFISKYRLTTMAPFVPLGLLVSMTASWITTRFKKKIVTILFYGIILLTTVPVTISYIPKLYGYIKTTKVATRFYHFYIPRSDWDAMYYAKDHMPRHSIVLSNRFFGSLLPAYVEVISYIGHHVHTQHFDFKNWQIDRFYSNQMSILEAWKFLKDNNIQYVWYGPGEMLQSSSLRYASFLTPWYSSNGTTIYQVP